MSGKEFSEMPLTPNEIGKKKFSVSYGRGYSREEVDAFLARVSTDYSAAIQKIAAAAEGKLSLEDDFGIEVAEVLRAARESATRIRNKAKAEANGIVENAEEEARRLREELNSFKRETKEKAEADAKESLDEARKHAEEVRDSASRERLETLALVQERYGALLEHEKDLRERVVALERLVSEMRGLMEPLEEIDLSEFDLVEENGDDEGGAWEVRAEREQSPTSEE